MDHADLGFFFTSIVSVVTGSSSLITAPVMFGLGIEPKTALATNMLALMFMNVGGTVPNILPFMFDRRSNIPQNHFCSFLFAVFKPLAK